MITFIVLLVSLLSLAIAGALIVLAGGAGFLLAFGDVIVCVLILGLIVRLIMRRK